MTANGKPKGERIMIALARELSKRHAVLIHWRPEPELPESEQYALLKTNIRKGTE